MSSEADSRHKRWIADKNEVFVSCFQILESMKAEDLDEAREIFGEDAEEDPTVCRP